VARALVAAHPQDGRAWDALATYLERKGELAEVSQARTRAAELMPDDADILNKLAWTHLQKGETVDGLKVVSRALALAPGNVFVLDTHAALLFQLHRCPEAIAMQRRAMDMLHEHAPESMRQALGQRLQQYEKQCASEALETPAP
jgi:tetratricopeptide (TPR) repeat protein